MSVTAISLVLEIDGKPHIALINEIDPNLLINVIAGLTKDGTLKVVKMSDDFKIERMNHEHSEMHSS